MLARAYDTPCPVDVIEKVLEGASERSGQIPIHTIGQLAESMGLQTQVGSVKFEQMHRLELPVIVAAHSHFALLTQVKEGKVLLADPERGWRTLPFEEVRADWGNDVQVVLVKRLADTPTKQFGWSWFAPVLKRFQWPLIQVLLALTVHPVIPTRQSSAIATDHRQGDQSEQPLSPTSVRCRSGRGCVVPRAADGGAHLVVDRHHRPHGLTAGKPSDRQAVAATASLFRKKTRR